MTPKETAEILLKFPRKYLDKADIHALAADYLRLLKLAEQPECEAERMRALQPNWDSYGAPAISEAAITAAVQTMRSGWQFTPCSNGGVQIDWGCGTEVSFGPDGEQEFDDAGQPETRNSLALASITAYCREHPGQRFWQALRNWSKWSFILGFDSQADEIPPYSCDTFNIEGLDGTRDSFNDFADAANTPATSPAAEQPITTVGNSCPDCEGTGCTPNGYLDCRLCGGKGHIAGAA